MNREIQEVKLPSGPRGQALLHARIAVNSLAAAPVPHSGDAIDEAFASYQPASRRTDGNHADEQDAKTTRDAIQQITRQLQQIDDQRRELSRLLTLLDSEG
ncbi:hypothetical protein Pla123a_41110 [Posidoniimonas polymericola]|uniref:Uncharacterized protein n=1 Tax=Posidoniimonas polymericola TaxID=2528002 RepID=A0A5C5YEB9_9BACT|nr:hypothetical protein [Posidoniimonas polymericola]TWT72811.1 hypothetical protein Pla123a_41110 [Posidoniimonas polymericola]